MINFTNITKAIETLIKEYDSDNDKEYHITRNKKQNMDDSIAVDGWVGIYRDSIDYSTHSSGANPWLAEPKLRLEIQSASMESEEDCEEKLEVIVDHVLNAVQSDRTIGGTVLMVTALEIDYDDNYSEQMQTFYQFATLTITTEVKA